jgi:hypothetical protein
MSVSPPALPPRSAPLPDGELEHLLSAFYKSELPDPFPSLQAPTPLVERAYPEQAEPFAPAGGRRAPVASRVALAASVAVLFGSCWYLSGTRPEEGPAHDGNLINSGGSAKRIVIGGLPRPSDVPAPNPPGKSAHPTERGR